LTLGAWWANGAFEVELSRVLVLRRGRVMDSDDGPLVEHTLVLVAQLWIICSVHRRGSSGWHHGHGVLLVRGSSLDR